ncbi:class I SAM-dependent methyltransferase [Amycolatopsis sp. H20-H5]|uniref:class I SAM-dependent methyltransferase n=1 Tax=Amycolatopsis sp. H20-H5 TaxID=3046309 RepID=UPI002DBB65CD|nr:methyltransferase domain-containing protein [Amycolatopsis sp. H20-H5]MEC3980081.1 methyltransferase domain-containing protein [Amycolatopsis sp. H20-H5]
MTATESPAGSLRDFYEAPEVPISSGSDRANRQLRMLADVLRTRPGRQRILDVGCGDGAATSLVARFEPANHVIGLDWSTRAVRTARDYGFDMISGGVDGPGLPIASESMDVVIMSELIEHLVDTDAALTEALRVLRPGGALLLSTPNLAAWYNRVLLAVGVQPIFTEVGLRGIHGRPGAQVVGHLRLLTRRALVGLLRANGFERIDVTGARYHDVPAMLAPIDRLLCHWPGAASILLAAAFRATTPPSVPPLSCGDEGGVA